jgi:hypothetical protein
MKIRVTAVSCSSYKKKENDKNEKLEILHNIFINSNSELIQQMRWNLT